MKKVLAVDDDHDVLYTLEAIGGVADFHLVTVDNGFAALDLLKKEEFHLVVVDYYMPEMNGMELVAKVRELNQRIPILVLTVDESLDIADKFLELGATDFATKPIRVADLISRVNLHLNLSHAGRTSLFERIEIPKGISSPTLQVIVDYLGGADEPEDLDTVAQGTGLAYQTVHRYLSFLEQEGHVDVALVYGKVGRPVKVYKLK